MRSYDDLMPGRTLWFVPGVSTGGQAGVPDVMRGEETQLVGLIAALGDGAHVACLPGTHSKWARIGNGQLTGFATVMTGELYAVLCQHSILGKLMEDDHAALDTDAFVQGIDRSAAPGGLSHHLFGTRTLGLFERLSSAALPSYLSGLLIGHELREHRGDHATVHLVGSPGLAQRYALRCSTWRRKPAAPGRSGGGGAVRTGQAAQAGLTSHQQNIDNPTPITRLL